MQRGDSAELICSGCRGDLGLGEEYLQCMVKTCNKLYHLLCTSKKLTTKEKDSWVCPECCIRQKRIGSNCETPVGTPVTTKNISVRNKSAPSVSPSPQPEFSSQVASIMLEMQGIRNQMSILTEQLSNAVSVVTQYQAALADCSMKIGIASERLVRLEQSSTCHCQADKPREPNSGNAIPLSDARSEGKPKPINRKISSMSNLTVEPTNVVAPCVAEQSFALPTRNAESTDTTHVDHNESGQGTWQKVLGRKKRFSSVRGTAGPHVTSLKAIECRKFIHLWNMISGADDVREYLHTLYPGKTFTIEELKPKGDYKSFKIGVPKELYEECLTAEMWPENARVRVWFFRRSESSGKPPTRAEQQAKNIVVN